jgi:hypothetical protein
MAYEDGIALALSAFQEVQAAKDPQIIMLAESSYTRQELNFCHPDDKDTQSSLSTAVQGFDDALRCLKTVGNRAAYRHAETTHPTDPKKRKQGCPKDAFHQCCSSHFTRLINFSRTPGVNMIEKDLYKQRRANMKAAQAAYLALQKKALDI